MKVLYPPESARDVRARKARSRRTVFASVAAFVVLVIAGVYLWPQSSPTMGELFQEADPRVVSSLRGFRGDHPIQRVDVRGRIWPYVRLGESPEAVLFVHGMGGSYDIWWQQMRALVDRYTVISVAYAAEPYLDGSARALESVLDREGIERVHLVGTSMGGYVAQYFASTEPERVTSLVLSNTFPPGDWIEEEYGTLASLLPILPAWTPQRFYRKSIEESIFPASGGSQLVRGYLLEQSYRMSKNDFRARVSVLRQGFAVPDLEALGIPALIIEADNDPLVPAEVRAALTRTYSSAPVITMRDVGHFPYLNRPAAYTGILEDFWNGLRVADTLPVSSPPPSSPSPADPPPPTAFPSAGPP